MASMATKSSRTNVYTICAILFFLAFVCFVFGFSCPAWIIVTRDSMSDMNAGLWQLCEVTFDNCKRVDFTDGSDTMVGVRVVMIFALVMFVAVATHIVYENCCTKFRARPFSERVTPGIICILGGIGGLIGVIMFAVDTDNDDVPNVDYGWALALAAGSSALAVLVGVGFCVSGLFLERRARQERHHPKTDINGHTPYLTTNDENYEMNVHPDRNVYDARSGRPDLHGGDNLPGFAVYNGMLMQPGHRNSLPLAALDHPRAPPPQITYDRWGGGAGGPPPPPVQTKHSHYYSLSDDRLHDRGFDLSEGYTYLPSRARPSARGLDNPGFVRDPSVYQREFRAEDPYSRGGGRPEDPYYRGGREEDPYSHGARDEDPYKRVHKPRAGYNDPYGFDRLPSGRHGSPSVGGSVNYGGGLPTRGSYRY